MLFSCVPSSKLVQSGFLRQFRNFSTIFASVVDTSGKFAAGVNDTGGEFATGVVDTGGNFG